MTDHQELIDRAVAASHGPSRVTWSDEVDEVIRGDLTAAAAYLTPAGGAVATSVAPCGIDDRHHGTVGYTTSLGFAKKLEHIVREPRVALAYHAREHGFASSRHFVLVQGTATIDLTPSRERLEEFLPQAERYLGEIKTGLFWDRLLHAYYYERVFVDIAVERIVAWPDLAAAGPPTVFGPSLPPAPERQRPPAKGTAPRVDVAAAAGRISALPHRLLAYRGDDGLPVVVPVDLAGHDTSGLQLIAEPGLLPSGGRRAGLLAHAYRPNLVGLSTRSFTGWLEVDADGSAAYAPHTSTGFTAPAYKDLQLVINGLLSTIGIWRARRRGTTAALARIRRSGPS